MVFLDGDLNEVSISYFPSFRDIFLLGYIDILLFTHYVLNESNERNAT